MLNYIKLICFVTVFLVVNVVAEDGFTSRCDFNKTLFVRKGNNATFNVVDNFDYPIIRFYRGITKTRSLLYAHIFGPDHLDIRRIDDRVNLTVTDERTITITLQYVTQDDRGMFLYRGLSTYCWELFVLDVWNPKNITFEENLPAYIDGSPPASSMVRPRVNATATWLLDSLNFSKTTDFMEQDGRMIIMRTPRHLDTKNVTYRITEDNGDVHDVNLTLWVLYGPYSPLHFSPSKTSYTVTSGDVLPDITCSTDCNPPCEITWDRSGVGNVLSLGKVDKSSKGLYTCQATRNGTDHVVERSLYVEVNDTLSDIMCNADCSPSCDVRWESHSYSNILSLGKITADMSGEYVCEVTQNYTGRTAKRSIVIHIKDETSLIVAVSILGTFHGITLVFLCVLTVYWHRTSGSNGSCLKGIRARTDDKMQNRTETQHQHETHISTIEMEHYEGLDRSENVNIDTQDAYENLKIGT